ncbi:hypothetical protein LTR86_008782 [Recurvomyces mirabilis]|nr:hypothetical protein LTR86_008782 [Recurvomyces mirabilis]
MKPSIASSSAMEYTTDMELEDRHGTAAYDLSDIAKGIALTSTTSELYDGDAETADKDQAALLATKSTPADAVAMKRVGKDQQLVRQFRQVSITSFVALATASWEIGLFVLTPALVDGGVSGMCWSVIGIL